MDKRGREATLPLVLLALLLLVVCALVIGCGGSTPSVTEQTQSTGTTSVASTTTTTTLVAVEPLSTFEAKDPFVPRVVSTTTTTRSSTSSSRSSTSTSTPTTYPTQVTSGQHYLKLLSISTVNGTPVCTFEVDRVAYQDKKVGEGVTTSWGEVKVLAISTQNQTATFRRGSETQTLSLGQRVVK